MPDFYVTKQRSVVIETKELVRARSELDARLGKGSTIMNIGNKQIRENTSEIVSVLPAEEGK